MIRLSVEADSQGLIALWQEAFGDSEEAIRMFLDFRYVPVNTVVAEENGRIVSMLFLLEGKLKIKNRLYPSYYLYAAATAKSERGRGLMPELLAFAENVARNREVDFICLKPAGKSLYDYYCKFGYKSVFSTKIVKINNFDKNDFLISNEAKIDWARSRNKFLSESDAFIWDDSAIDFAVRQHLYYGGKVLRCSNGYCLYTVDDGKCTVKEWSFTDAGFNDIISFMQYHDECDEIYVELPVDRDFKGYDFEIKDNGMALAVSDSAKSFVDKIENAYLNLTLD